MKFHVEFTYRAEEREKLLNLLQVGGLPAEGPVKVLGAWIAIQTGAGFAMVDTHDSRAFYELCSTWSEYGQIKITPVIDVASI